MASLCSSCEQFFHQLADQIGTPLTSGRRSASDWPFHRVKLHSRLSLLKLSAEHPCPLCSLIYHGLKRKGGLESAEPSAVYLKTNPGGRSPSREWQTCHLIAEVVTSSPQTVNRQTSSPCLTQSSIEILLQGDSVRNWPRSLKETLSKRIQRGDCSTSSEPSFELVSWWMEQCKSRHRLCNSSQSALPSRVIDVGPPGGSQEPFLYESQGEEGAYTTLSYCWGDTTPLMTTKETMAERKAGIPLSIMPATYRDAVEITRRLGIRFLWIDALCIVQGSFEDWEAHSARMCKVYKHSFCTIAACHARNPSEGCFALREGLQNHPYLIESQKYDNHDVWIATMATQPTIEPPLHRRAWVLQEQLLSPRVLQYHMDGLRWRCAEAQATERVPNLRVGLDGICHFQRAYISSVGFESMNLEARQTWQVKGELVANSPPVSTSTGSIGQRFLKIPRLPRRTSEPSSIPLVAAALDHEIIVDDFPTFEDDLPIRSPGVLATATPTPHPILPARRDRIASVSESDTLIKTIWHEIIEDYTSRDMTRETDRLAAILGVAEAISTKSNSEFQAGLFFKTFRKDLIWAAERQKTIVCTRPAQLVAPSWSWASLNCPVKYGDRGHSMDERVHWTCSVSRPNLIGSPSSLSGSIGITGTIRTAYTTNENPRMTSTFDFVCRHGGKNEVLFKSSKMLWKPDDQVPPNKKIWFIELGRVTGGKQRHRTVIYKYKHYVEVILLGLVRNGSRNEFRRIGIAFFPIAVFSNSLTDPLILSQTPVARSSGITVGETELRGGTESREEAVLEKHDVVWKESRDTLTVT